LGNPLAAIFALGAAMLYRTGNDLEHRVVADTGGDGRVRVGLLGRLVRSPLWVLGMFGDVGAYGLQAAALAYGGLLFVQQPLLVCVLLIALPLNTHWMHRRIRAREWLAATVLCASLATFLIEAEPNRGNPHAPVENWVRIAGTIAFLALAAVAVSAMTRGHVRTALLGFVALLGLIAPAVASFSTAVELV